MEDAIIVSRRDMRKRRTANPHSSQHQAGRTRRKNVLTTTDKSGKMSERQHFEV
jgi:hypothetical protein